MIACEMTRLDAIKQCPKPIIEYRYVPRSFKEEQAEPIPIKDIFGTMFANPSPWMMSRGIGLTDKHVTNGVGNVVKKNTGLENQKQNFDFRPKPN
jgi:hypothetical protein